MFPTRTPRALFTLGLFLGVLNTAFAAFTASIDSVSITSGTHVIDSDDSNGAAGYDRDTITVNSEVTFSGFGSSTYRYDYQLLDDNDTAMLLDDGSGGTTTTFEGTNFSVTTAVTKITDDSLTPAAELDPNRQYRVRILVKEQTPFFITKAQDDTTAQDLIHFTNTDPIDAEFNVLVRTNSVSWQKRWVLDTDSVANNQKLRLQVHLALWRYDNFDETMAGTDSIPHRINYQLRESGTGTVVATASTAGTLNLPMDEFTVSTIKEPFERTANVNFRPDPAAQLESHSKQYYVTASVEHKETAGGAYEAVGDDVDSPTETLLHYNGTLTGDGDTLIMTTFGNDPVTTGFSDLGSTWLTNPQITAGYVANHPTWLASSTMSYDIELFDDGHAELVNPGDLFDITAPAVPDSGTINNIHFVRSSTTFGTDGYKSDLTVTLPDGLGVYVKDPGALPDYALIGLLDATGVLLDDDLNPSSSVTFPLPGTAGPSDVYYLVEETKPIEIAASSIIWGVSSGQISPGAAPGGTDRVRYRRMVELDLLDSSGLPADDRIVRSNELYWRHVSGTLPPFGTNFSSSLSGSASLNANIDIDPGSMRTHFPYDATLTWSNPGSIQIVEDLVVPVISQLGNLDPISLPYARDCEDFLECGTTGDSTVSLAPANPLIFTRDGGGGTSGTFEISYDDNLQIGYIDELSPSPDVYAHETDSFVNGSFLMAGHFLRGADFSIDLDDGPGILLNSGFDPSDYNTVERPETTAYEDGFGDYPGMNYRVTNETPSPSATSVLGGVPTPTYTLGSRSKYYTRQSGVTGIHEPTTNPFSGPVTIYGYEFTFTSFGLSFMGSEVHDSTTAGSVYVPYPSDFTLFFDKLWFNCIGGLTTAEISGGTMSATLPFWDAEIVAAAAYFEPAADADCDPSDAFLVLGCQGWASNITEPLTGNLGFIHDGNLLTAANSDSPGIDSRMSIPNNATIAGPNDETYPFLALHEAYYDNYYHAADTTAGVGRINLVGNLGVAFFEDLDVHLRTGANEDNTTDTIDITGGWDASGTAFELAEWDLDNHGRPTSVTLDAYLADGAYPTHARQNWIGIVPFDYPLVWSSTTRAFRAEAPVTNEKLLVLTTEHECTFLSAETAELDFGANVRLDIPEINLSNLSTNALEGSGVLESLTQSLADQASGALFDGLDSSAELLNDQMDDFYDRIFAESVDPIVETLYDQLAAAPDLGAMQDEVDDYLTGTSTSVREALYDIDGAFNQNGSVIYEVDQALVRVQMGIRAVIGRLEVDGGGNLIIDPGTIDVPEDLVSKTGGPIVEGIFANADGTGYDIAEALTVALIENLAPDIADSLSSALTTVSGSLLDKLEDELNARFGDMEPTLEQVKQVLMELHNAIHDIRDAGALYTEISTTVTGAKLDIDDLTNEAADAIKDFLGSIDFDEYSEEEVKELIHAAIRDSFNASPLISDIQVVLKGYIYDIDAAMNEAISSGFGELNRLITGLLDDLVPMDSALDGMLGDLADISAAGQVDGYAQINGDALRTLRLDAAFQFQIPDPFEINGYLEINQLDSMGDDSCSFSGGEGEYAAEVKLGATDIPVKWLGNDLRFSVETKYSFDTDPDPGTYPDTDFALRGMGGAFEMTEGEISVEAMAITDLGAAAAFGLDENYLAAKVGLRFESYSLAGGVFFGKSCSIDPLELVDEDVAEVLGDDDPLSFTGFYAYGEAEIPIINGSCLLRLSAKAGIGVFYFQEGPTYGGKMLMGASGEALCAVNVGGEVVLVGAKSGNVYSFLGKGTIYGEIGKKPLRIKFNQTVTLTYKNGKWDYDY